NVYKKQALEPAQLPDTAPVTPLDNHEPNTHKPQFKKTTPTEQREPSTYKTLDVQRLDASTSSPQRLHLDTLTPTS
ncbi:hypothetical protein, partial [Nonomuraea antri]|uniref:hypothetical protein n=1 Tax=Nonomuraea antri TaxID=2730852 RepID=UPI001C2C9184